MHTTIYDICLWKIIRLGTLFTLREMVLQHNTIHRYRPISISSCFWKDWVYLKLQPYTQVSNKLFLDIKNYPNTTTNLIIYQKSLVQLSVRSTPDIQGTSGVPYFFTETPQRTNSSYNYDPSPTSFIDNHPLMKLKAILDRRILQVDNTMTEQVLI